MEADTGWILAFEIDDMPDRRGGLRGGVAYAVVGALQWHLREAVVAVRFGRGFLDFGKRATGGAREQRDGLAGSAGGDAADRQRLPVHERVRRRLDAQLRVLRLRDF